MDPKVRKAAFAKLKEIKDTGDEAAYQSASEMLRKKLGLPVGTPVSKLEEDMVKFTSPVDRFKTPDLMTEKKGLEYKLGLEKKLKGVKPTDVLDYTDFGKRNKVQTLKKLSKLGKKLPAIGGLIGPALAGIAALSGDKAQASEIMQESAPILGEAEELGPTKGTIERKMEMGEPLSIEEQQELRRRSEEQDAKMKALSSMK